MDTQAEDGSHCLVCHEALLSQPAVALRCGHVFHCDCFQQWMLKSNGGECPGCRAVTRTDELRILQFDLVETVPEARQQSFEEVLRLQAASAEERTAVKEELRSEEELADAETRAVGEELSACKEVMLQHKRARKELQQRGVELVEEVGKMKPRLEEVLIQCQQVEEQIAIEKDRQYKKLPIAQSREDDEDAQEERRVLRSLRPADRASQLHAALLSARQQVLESKRLFQRHQKEFESVEAELKCVRERRSELQHEQNERRAAQQLHHEAPTVPSLGSSSVSGGRLARLRGAEAPKLKEEQKAKKPKEVAQQKECDDDDDDSLLYSAPMRRGAGRGGVGFLAKRCPRGGTPAAGAAAQRSLP